MVEKLRMPGKTRLSSKQQTRNQNKFDMIKNPAPDRYVIWKIQKRMKLNF